MLQATRILVQFGLKLLMVWLGLELGGLAGVVAVAEAGLRIIAGAGLSVTAGARTGVGAEAGLRCG